MSSLALRHSKKWTCVRLLWACLLKRSEHQITILTIFVNRIKGTDFCCFHHQGRKSNLAWGGKQFLIVFLSEIMIPNMMPINIKLVRILLVTNPSNSRIDRYFAFKEIKILSQDAARTRIISFLP